MENSLIIVLLLVFDNRTSIIRIESITVDFIKRQP
ncbi:hypothetical protein NT05LI_3811, partial [Listeria ivanovii FSL F6-596]